MESVSSFFKVEKDIFYQVGEKRGLEKGRKESERKTVEFVKNLLLQTDFTVSKIAMLANTEESFVQKIKDKLK